MYHGQLVLLSSLINIWCKSVKGFMSYKLTTKQTDRQAEIQRLLLYNSVLRIHSILMRIRIWILDPHREKNGSWSRSFLLDLLNFLLTINNFQICLFFCLFLSLNLMNQSELKKFLWSLFFQKFSLGVKKKIFSSVFDWYFTPWIRIRGSSYFFGSGSRKSKSADPKHCFIYIINRWTWFRLLLYLRELELMLDQG